jgi:hypothetical protein
MTEANRLSPEIRYHRDAQFHTIVDHLELLIREAQFTGTELREAAILACIHHEERSSRARFMTDRGPHDPTSCRADDWAG